MALISNRLYCLYIDLQKSSGHRRTCFPCSQLPTLDLAARPRPNACVEIDTQERRVKLSAKDFATFGLPGAMTSMRAQAWRAAVGTAWHNDLRNQTAAEDTTARFEVPFNVLYPQDGWTFEIGGRIDQLLPTAVGSLLREIKTVTRNLPESVDSLRADYPEHFLQLACYLALAPFDPNLQDLGELSGELVFVDYRAGVLQNVPAPENWKADFEAQAARLAAWLEERREHEKRLRRLDIPPAFAELRPEQAAPLHKLQQSLAAGGIALFQAPTGFGKTGLALQAALEQVRNGKYDRVLFLSGKSTGQMAAMRQLEAFSKNNSNGPHCFQMRSKREHAERCPLPRCDGRKSCQESLRAAPPGLTLSPSRFLQGGSLRLDGVLSLSAECGLCPYEISRAALPGAEVWVCDYNYIFSPPHRGTFDNQLDFRSARTCLIVDEAHNLPSRVEDVFSFAASAGEAVYIVNQLRLLGAWGKIIAAWEAWADFLDKLKPKDRHESLVSYEAADALEALTQATGEAQLDWDTIPDEFAERLFAPYWWLEILRTEGLAHLVWTRAAGELRVDCLDAASAIGPRLREFGAALLMSATLDPLDVFRDSAGLDAKETQTVRAGAPWREEGYRVAIDARIDTRFRRRADYYAVTAQTVATLADATATPVAVFFPSYQYAETIRAYLGAEQPGLTVAMQPRAIDLDGQMRFIDEALLTAHALFFVLGSSFSESIDQLGGKIEAALVVGPALPEVSPLQKARETAHAHAGRDEAFRRAWIVPAMQKINQALGRLVRAPGQQARVVLHCRRFRDEAYRNALDVDFTPEETLRGDEDLLLWLRG